MKNVFAKLSVCGACSAVALAGPDPVPVMQPEVRFEQPLRIAPIVEYTDTWHFKIGEWIDVSDRGNAVPEDPTLQWFFDLGQRSIVDGTSVAGCQDNSGVTGRYLLTADSGARWYSNLVAQNDITVPAGTEGLNSEYFVQSYARQADDNFFVVWAMFDDYSDNTTCVDSATFLGGFVQDFGFRLGDITGPSDGHDAFFFNTATPAADGITFPAPPDGQGTYRVAYGNAYDDVTGTLTPHPSAQSGLWCTSEWGGLADRPGSSHEVSTVDNEDGFFDPGAECTDSFNDTRNCAWVIEPMLSIAATYDTDTCPCTADLAGDNCGTNTNDFFQFLAYYQTQDLRADFSPTGGDGFINTNDFFAYLAAYQADLNNVDCPG